VHWTKNNVNTLLHMFIRINTTRLQRISRMFSLIAKQ
jgi:hypothetical protein